MVNIKIGEENHIFTLDMSGHAVDADGYTGEPEVCAACSAIAYMVLGWTTDRFNPEYTEADGEMHITLNAAEMSCGQIWETAAVWDAAEIGLRQIAQLYHEYVSVED